MTKLTPELREAVIAEYKTGELKWIIAQRHKIAESSVRKIALEAGLPSRTKGCRPGLERVAVYGKL